MKEAIVALDGGGSNLRILIADSNTEEELYFKEISTGTNLSTVPNREEALRNIKKLIVEGCLEVLKDGYKIIGIGLSSAGTEIKADKEALERALEEAVEKLLPTIKNNKPQLYVTNDIDILLHSSDIALVAGTGTVGAVKYKDVEPYDNIDEAPEEYQIKKFDGNGQFLGDKGSGFWIAQEVLKRVAEIENLGGYIDRKSEFVDAIYDDDLYMRQLVFQKLFKELGIPEDKLKVALELGLEAAGLPEFVSLVYSATEENGRPFDRAKVGNLFAIIAEEAAIYGDSAANDILKQASIELFKNIKAAYEIGNFKNKERCDVLLSGSVLVHSEIIRYFLETVVEEKYPNVRMRINDEKPVWSTFRYIRNKLEDKIKSKTQSDEGMEK